MFTTFRTALIAIATLAALDSPGTSQVPVDARIRVRLASPDSAAKLSAGEWYIGELRGLQHDTLRVRLPWDSLVAIPSSLVDRVEFSQGRHSNAAGGALVGGLVGASLGIVIGELDRCSPNPSGFEGLGCTTHPGKAAISIGLLGVVVGVVVGASEHERWKSIPEGTNVQPALQVGHDFVNMGLALRW